MRALRRERLDFEQALLASIRADVRQSSWKLRSCVLHKADSGTYRWRSGLGRSLTIQPSRQLRRGPTRGVSHCMKVLRGSTYRADRAWGAVDIANMGGVTTRLHWTDQPYEWHVNDGEEVFAVLAGRVDMRFRDETGAEQSTLLETGDVFYASIGTEHVAHPVGEARILVVEREGSV